MKSTITMQGRSAIEYAEEHGLRLWKYADPTEDAREVTVEEASEDVTMQDSSLVVLFDEVRLGDAKAAREDRIISAAHLCRAADEDQAQPGDELTAEASGEQAGTIETMRQALDGEEPTRSDWRIFSTYY